MIRSKPSAERQACRHLDEQGYAPYLPMHTFQQPDRVLPTLLRTATAPLFRGYLFLQLSDDEPTYCIAATYGVAQLLPGHVAAGAVEALQASEAERQCVAAAKTQWRPGRACGLANGVFRGQRAVIKRIEGEIALVTLMMLGELRDVSMPVSWLRDVVG